MKTILRELFYGRYIPYEHIAPKNHSEYIEVNAKITSEKGYFKNLLSEDNYIRLEKLETLYTDSSEIEVETAYMAGFKLAVMIMAEIYACNGQMSIIDETNSTDNE